MPIRPSKFGISYLDSVCRHSQVKNLNVINCGNSTDLVKTNYVHIIYDRKTRRNIDCVVIWRGISKSISKYLSTSEATHGSITVSVLVVLSTPSVKSIVI